jgi:glycosyltransferase involved in cell wall biosynthesis
LKSIIHVIPTLENAGAETILARIVDEFDKNEIDQMVVVTKGIKEDFFYPMIKEICPILLWEQEKQKTLQLIKRKFSAAPFLAWMYEGIYFAYKLKLCYRFNQKVIWNIRQSNFRSSQIKQKTLLYVFGLWSRWTHPKIIYCAYAAQITHHRFFFSKKQNKVIQNRLAKKKEKYAPDTSQLPDHFLLFVGRYDPIKGIDRLFRIATQFFSSFPDYKLVIAGSGWNSKIIPEEIAGSVMLLGQVSNVNILYQKADCYLFTSYFEGFPNVLVEAVCNGCPVLAFPAGDAEIILKNYPLGQIVDKEETLLHQLGQKIKNKPPEEQRLMEAKLQKQRFRFENTVKEYKDFIFEE